MDLIRKRVIKVRSHASPQQGMIFEGLRDTVTRAHAPVSRIKTHSRPQRKVRPEFFKLKFQFQNGVN